MPGGRDLRDKAMTDDVLDDLFHGCALAAYLQQASAQRGWPDCEATRSRAFALYEQALRMKHDAADAERHSGDCAYRNSVLRR